MGRKQLPEVARLACRDEQASQGYLSYLRLIFSKLKKIATVRDWNRSRRCAKQIAQAWDSQYTRRQLAGFFTVIFTMLSGTTLISLVWNIRVDWVSSRPGTSPFLSIGMMRVAALTA